MQALVPFWITFIFTAYQMPATGLPFAGTYAGTLAGETAALVLRQEASQITGSITSGGSVYRLSGVAHGTRLQGRLEDPDSGISFEIEAELNPGELSLSLLLTDPDSGQTQRVTQIFRRRGGDSAQAPPKPAPGGPMGSQNDAGDPAGSYSGTINGTPSTMTLKLEGHSLAGRVESAGYLYNLAGTHDNGALKGTLSDPRTGAALPFEGRHEGGRIRLEILSQNGAAGTPERLALDFRKQAPGQGDSRPSGEQAPAESADLERDAALVGSWQYSKSMTSGDFSAVIQKVLIIRPDGTYVLGDGRVVGGGGAGSFDSGSGGGAESNGTWKTSNRIVYIREGGAGSWTPYARYYVEAGKLMFTFGDGSREIWYRR